MRYLVMLLLAIPMVAVPSRTTLAAPAFGSVESFPGVTTGDWAPGQGSALSNPGTGGLGGAGDGYLVLTLPSPFHFGMRNEGSLYAGDWSTPGITHISLWLNDVGADDAFEIHFAMGNGGNRWQYNIGFTPPEGQWERFVVDLTNAANFTQIIGSGTFADALLTADRIQLRHDFPPFMREPDNASGDLGIDEIVIGDLATPTRETSWGRLKSMYR